MKIEKSLAFTLLEMLVVLGIIGTIVSLGFVSYTTAQKKARDAKRKQDLKAIQNALEQYYSICHYVYPNPDSGNKVPTSIICSDPYTVILNNVPTDPKTNARYTMTQTTNSDYTICAPNNPPLESESVITYCLTQQQ